MCALNHFTDLNSNAIFSRFRFVPVGDLVAAVIPFDRRVAAPPLPPKEIGAAHFTVLTHTVTYIYVCIYTFRLVIMQTIILATCGIVKRSCCNSSVVDAHIQIHVIPLCVCFLYVFSVKVPYDDGADKGWTGGFGHAWPN